MVFDHKDISVDNNANCQETIAEIDEVGKEGKEVAESNIFTNPHSKATNSEDVADEKKIHFEFITKPFCCKDRLLEILCKTFLFSIPTFNSQIHHFTPLK